MLFSFHLLLLAHSAPISPAGSTPAVGLLLRQNHAILVRDGPHRGEHDKSAQCNAAIHLAMQPKGGMRDGMDKVFAIDSCGSRAEPPFNRGGSRKLHLPVRSLASQIKVRAQPKVTAPVEKYIRGFASQLVRKRLSGAMVA